MKSLAQIRVLAVLLVAFFVVSCGGEGGNDDTTTTQPDAVAETTTTTAPEVDDDDEGGSLGGLSSTCLEAPQGLAAAVNAYSPGMAEAIDGRLDD